MNREENYNKNIRSLANPTFQKIRNIAMDELRSLPDTVRNELYERIEHGVKILETHEELCQYLWSFGNMHEAKVRHAVQKISYDVFNDNEFEVIDWGCGQGLASVCLFDYLRDEHIDNRVRKVTLIEPSEIALRRAELHVGTYCDESVEIAPVRKMLDDVSPVDILARTPVIIHFFSNILDIGSIDLKGLAQKVCSNKNAAQYFVCIGPLNFGWSRIDSFFEFFQNPTLLHNELHGYNEKTKYTAKYLVFKLERNQLELIKVDYYPPAQFHAGYQLDAVRRVLATLDKETFAKVSALYAYDTKFEVAAPFDVGARISDDVNPILAVLNNIVTRGLPTKASPTIEKAFEKLGNKLQRDELGGISFDCDGLSADDIFLALHLIDGNFLLNESNYNVNALDSDFEKDFITQMAPPIIRQLAMPQRPFRTIVNSIRSQYSRIDFSIEFPYVSKDSQGQNCKGVVFEIDGAKYHSAQHQQDADRSRDYELKQQNWSCFRIKENGGQRHIPNSIFELEYIKNVRKTMDRSVVEPDWNRTLQLVLSPLAIARLQKTVIEAMITGKLDFQQPKWRVLVKERDVPCAALAFKDLAETFDNLTALSEQYVGIRFPEIELHIISPKAFKNSPLHIGHKVSESIDTSIDYDLIIDTSMLRRSNIENLEFSDACCKNECYFTIRSAHFSRSSRKIYTSDRITYRQLTFRTQQGTYADIEETVKHLRYFVQLLFRKKDFRSGQIPILNRALQGKNVIGLLPTGGGKSLTYQLSAMLQPGVTIVIDPLKSLMDDQIDGLMKYGIDACTYINGDLAAREKESRALRMEQSEFLMVLMSPERLCLYNFRERLRNMHNIGVYFSYGVIDEVHCVSEWGHDFRFTYLHLGSNLYKYVLPKQIDNERITLMGLTATASFDVLADVERELSGNGAFPLDADTIVRDENTNRLELQYKIEKVAIPLKDKVGFDKRNHIRGPVGVCSKTLPSEWDFYEAKKQFACQYVNRLPQLVREIQEQNRTEIIRTRFKDRQNLASSPNGDLTIKFDDDFYSEKDTFDQSGIVFCLHANGSFGVNPSTNHPGVVNAMSTVLQCKLGTFTGDDPVVSKENLDLFRNNKLPLMVATKAFGMGIDKPNVRFTINMNYSSSLEEFVQEAGRAGRDRRMALATILVSDYKLLRIKEEFIRQNNLEWCLIKQWFLEDDLRRIIDYFHWNVPDDAIDVCSPDKDFVKLKCPICQYRFAFGSCGSMCTNANCGKTAPNGNRLSPQTCGQNCVRSTACQLNSIPQNFRDWMYKPDLEKVLSQLGISYLSPEYYEYLNADYGALMYFYDNTFKGEIFEKNVMYDLLSRKAIRVFIGNDEEIKECETVNGFLTTLENSEVGDEIISFVSYNDNNYSDIAKAIYRMCCIGLIDDFTQYYQPQNYYRIVSVKKSAGEYYEQLHQFLLRYYSSERADEEIKKVPDYNGENEIHKCLGYLTEFVYSKIATKRKRAIDDIRNFCLIGFDDDADWKDLNEDLKDELFYYFNSKYARKDYRTITNKPYSLTDDTEGGKVFSPELLFKYMEVVNREFIEKESEPGTADVDNIKHLHGAVRLIRRSLTDDNPTLSLLNTFCLLFLDIKDNERLQEEMEQSYIEGMVVFYEITDNKISFWNEVFEKFNKSVSSYADKNTIKELAKKAMMYIHTNEIDSITKKYLS